MHVHQLGAVDAQMDAGAAGGRHEAKGGTPAPGYISYDTPSRGGWGTAARPAGRSRRRIACRVMCARLRGGFIPGNVLSWRGSSARSKLQKAGCAGPFAPFPHPMRPGSINARAGVLLLIKLGALSDGDHQP
jgi:hypothetical protein